MLTRATSAISAHDIPWPSSSDASAEVARSGSTSAALIVGGPDGLEVGTTVGVVEIGGRVGVAVGELDGGWLGRAVGAELKGATVGAVVGTEVGTAVGAAVAPRSKQLSRTSAHCPRSAVIRQWYGPTHMHRPSGFPAGAGQVIPTPWYAALSWPPQSTW